MTRFTDNFVIDSNRGGALSRGNAEQQKREQNLLIIVLPIEMTT